MQLRDYMETQNWARELDEQKSTSSYIFLLNNGVVS